VWSLRDDEAALDAVQDAMLKLAASYGDRPPGELPLLFQRILQNVIRDAHRRRKVRNAWVSLFSSFVAHGGQDEDDHHDPLDTLAADAAAELPTLPTPHGQFEREQLLNLIEKEIARLPERQRQAFLLRYWEEFDTAETAAAMGCSEGSVKTHCSRATQTLAAALRAKGFGS
jgi:RNA polymerase sigma-70 factor, ECF subfamily